VRPRVSISTDSRPEQLIWCYPESPAVGSPPPMLNAPAVDAEGRVFLQVADRLVALQQGGDKPALCWEYAAGSRAPGPVTIAPDGTLRLHTADGMLHALTPAGKPLWPPVLVGQPLPRAVPLVDAANNTWISAYGGGLLRVDPQGKCDPGRPFFRSRAILDAGGVIHDDVLYIGSQESCLFAIGLQGSHAGNLWDHASGRGQTGWVVRCWTALREDGLLIAAAADQYLYGFDLQGQLVWKTEIPGQMLGSPVVDPQGHIYVGVCQTARGRPARGLLVCVDGNSHKIRWQYEAADAVESTPVVGDDGLVYFGDNAGFIYALDLHGQLQWRAKLHSAVRSAGTIIARNRLAFGLDSQQLAVLECSSQGLAASGWPKAGKTLSQCGLA